MKIWVSEFIFFTLRLVDIHNVLDGNNTSNKKCIIVNCNNINIIMLYLYNDNIRLSLIVIKSSRGDVSLCCGSVDEFGQLDIEV